MIVRRNSSWAAVLVGVPLLLTALAGCTGGSADSGSTSPSESNAPVQMTQEDYDLAFAECMRDEGVEMPDPGEGGSMIANNDPAFVEAIETCATELGPAPGQTGTTDGASQHEANLEIAACLRENGIDIPDPQEGTGLTLPMDAPKDVLDECVGGAESGGN